MAKVSKHMLMVLISLHKEVMFMKVVSLRVREMG